MTGGAPSQGSRRAQSTAPRASARRPRRGEGETPPEIQNIPIRAIVGPRRPARRYLGDIAALADSMQEYGLQQPISVRREGDRFILTSGMRRLEAARSLGWKTILAFVRQVTADHAYLLDLIENLQRQDLSPEEEADAFGELVRTRGWTLQQVADGVKRSVSYVSKRVRIFEDPTLRDAVDRGLPVSTAEELLGAQAEQRTALIERALAEGWDQVRARDALRAAEAPAREDAPSGPTGRAGQAAKRATVPSGRPPGFTRAIRDFHRQILAVKVQDLTDNDRSALRSLYRDLVLLARASTRPAPRVFPKLPAPRSRR